MQRNGSFSTGDGDPPVVTTNTGDVQGFYVKSDKGTVRVFLGIPFAQPPVGDLRFRKTVPVEKWDGVLQCVRYRSRAPQDEYIWDRLELRVGQSEDCLYLNVIAPQWKPPAEEPNGFPVLVYIHGGGFVVDSAVKYHYRHIARTMAVHNVIVITIQYRLGFLGYFTTGDDHCLGNFGLWDQATALRWIHDNVACFGGDPERITVSGQSAGAASADLLSISPYTRDLFDQLILMGGNAECAWAVRDKKRIVQYCREHVEKLGWRGKDSGELMKWLRTLEAKKLRGCFIGNEVIFSTASLPLAPVYDGDFLPRPIDELRRESTVKRSIVGVCEHEGLLFVAVGRIPCNRKDVERGLSTVSTTFGCSIPNVMENVTDVYIPDKQDLVNRKTTQKVFVSMLDDVVGNFGCALYAKKAAERGGTAYMYSLEHCNPFSYGILGLFVPFIAATHATELIYLFNANLFITKFYKNFNDRKVAKEMTQRWMNFVKRRDPNIGDDGSVDESLVEWESVTTENVERHLRIAPQSEMNDRFRDGRMQRLRHIFGDNPIAI